jgi:outer membrane protein insertion porin family
MGKTRPVLWLIILSLLWFSQVQAQTKVVDIEVKGSTRRVAKSLILSTVGLKPGVELSQENVQEAMLALKGLNVFNDIQIWAEDVLLGVKLIIVVDEYPALEGIRFKGHKNLKEKEMKEALGLINGQVIADSDIARGRQKVLDLYNEKGYLRAEVTGKLFDAGQVGEVYLQYDIEEGEKVKIRNVNILGTQAFDAGKIKKQMDTKEKRWYRKGDFKKDVLNEDKEKILAFYRSKGYQQAIITRDSIYYDDTRKNLFIDLEVEEGQQYYLGDVSWEGNKLFDEVTLKKQLKVKEGEVFQFSGQELAWLVRSTYAEKGYLDTEIIPVESVRGDSIDVHFQVFEGDPFRIRRIIITGNTKTREKVLRRELALYPGDIYQQSLVQESQRRLFHLNYFKDVQVEPVPTIGENENFYDLTFRVEEKPTGTASMGAGYSDRDKLVGTVGLQIPNFRGKGQNLDFSWEFGSRREQFLVGFTEPWLLDTPTSLSVRIYTLDQQFFNAFDRKRNSITVRLGRRLKKPKYSSISLGYSLIDERYANFQPEYQGQRDDGRFQERTTSSFDLNFTRDSRDFPQFPTRGTMLSYRPELATTFVGSEVDFHSHEVQFNYYRPTIWKFVFSAETKVAVVDGFSAADDRNLPFFNRYTPGGVDWWDGQVRGYSDASLGPRDDETGLILGGLSMMVLNLEYRFPLVDQQVYGLVFGDAGNAWAGAFDIDPSDLRRSAGFGFRVITPMLGMIGFDFGYGFDRRKVDGVRPGWNTHFQFGPRFF